MSILIPWAVIVLTISLIIVDLAASIPIVSNTSIVLLEVVIDEFIPGVANTSFNPSPSTNNLYSLLFFSSIEMTALLTLTNPC